MSSNKGSGRSGHIEKNVIGKRGSGQLYATRQQQKQDEILRKKVEKHEDSARIARSSISKHKELRKIQVACAELEEELESKGASEEEIKRAVKEQRTKLTSKSDSKENKHNDIYSYKPRFASK
ncbi:hypothetical protein CORT_0A05530 [Candida orthopsilosis Co 90-125]|uniref:CWF21 domain-containing protein n=1 Tax=Candida orthopsilosis (strain 90-125) TaxID=1136231 RepID=H8WXZ3_CANO9|nr:hypothetical protein CORT_0A05530 [Candida orthopsilosis Co 90-125]CCG20940.1 hypothetical protein CORT_0A05530 [Candida orthopsilosis Co 90-125]